MQKNTLYDPVVDILRTIAILGVILVHTTTRTIEAVQLNIARVPWTLFLNQAARFAVPLFFLISGFVLELNHHLNESYLQYFKKRASRILVPYFFWSIIYYYFIYTLHRDPSLLNTFLTGDASYQLYFIPSLIIFYLLFPIIHKYLHFFEKKPVFVALGILQLTLLYLDYYVKPLQFFYPITIALLNFFAFYLGIFIAKHKQQFTDFINKAWFVLFVCALILSGFIFYEGFGGYLKTHNYLAFYSQWRPSVLFYALSFGGLSYWLFRKLNFPVLFVKTLSRLSFFVFFIHVIVLEAIWYLFLKGFFQNPKGIIFVPFWYDLLYFLSVAVISYLIAYIVHKISYITKITG